MEYRKIGKITQTLGLSGKMVLTCEASAAKSLLKLEHLFIELQKGHFIPFFPEAVPALLEGNAISWQLDEINSLEEVKLLLGKDVYIESDLYKKLFPVNSPLEEDLAGFQIKDVHSGNSATVQSVDSLPGQLMANVLFGEKTLLLPLSEDFIVAVDDKKKIIKMDLPDGIWDL